MNGGISETCTNDISSGRVYCIKKEYSNAVSYSIQRLHKNTQSARRLWGELQEPVYLCCRVWDIGSKNH
jgi:hypothetical protein